MSWHDVLSGVAVVRIGAHATEVWQRRGRWSRVVSLTHAARASVYQPDAIASPVCQALGKVQGRAVAVVESALMPILLADTGGVLWRGDQVEALLRRRLMTVYGGPDAGVSTWQVRAEHRFGARVAIGFASSPRIFEGLHQAAADSGVAWQAIVPAFAWGFDRIRRVRTGWWVWTEQDRSILARLRRGRVSQVHPAALVSGSGADLLRTVETEASRGGGSALEDEPIEVASWNYRGDGDGDDRLRWTSVEPSDSARSMVAPHATA